MQIDTKWNVGDDCWAIYSRHVSQREYCEQCSHSEVKDVYVKEIRRAKVAEISISVHDEQQVRISFGCTFDDYYCHVGEKVWATKEEAEKESNENHKKKTV